MAYETSSLDYAGFLRSRGLNVEVTGTDWKKYKFDELDKAEAERLLVEHYDRRCEHCGNSVRGAYEARRFLRGLSREE